MPKVRMPDGTVLEVGADALLDDNDNPLSLASAATGPTFTAADIEKARSEEKDKLYGKIDSLQTNIATLNEQIGGLTADQQRQKAALEEEQARLEAEARAVEEKELDAKSLLAKREQEWQAQIADLETTWSQKLGEEQAARESEAAMRAKEREFNDLREYAQAQVAANEDKIAPQLYGWIRGNSKEEIDATVAQAIQSTNDILVDIQQQQQQVQVGPDGVPVPVQQTPVPAPVTPGTRAVGGPAMVDPSGQYSQQLTPEQISQMPMDQYAKLRGQLGVANTGSTNRGMFG